MTHDASVLSVSCSLATRSTRNFRKYSVVVVICPTATAHTEHCNNARADIDCAGQMLSAVIYMLVCLLHAGKRDREIER